MTGVEFVGGCFIRLRRKGGEVICRISHSVDPEMRVAKMTCGLHLEQKNNVQKIKYHTVTAMKRNIAFAVACCALTIIFTRISLPQGERTSRVGKFVTGVKADSVFIFLTETPRRGTGFHVERKGPGEITFKRLTAEPIYGITNPEEARALLGDRYETVARAVRAESPQQMLLRLRGNAFAGGVLSLLHREVGTILGRFYIATDNQIGATYTYRVVFVNRLGKELSHEDQTVVIRETPPKPPSNLTLKPGDKVVTVQWEYPKWKPNTGDLCVLFQLYRQTGDGPFERIDQGNLLRIEGQPLEFRDNSVTDGVKYTYRMTAVDALGLESPASGPVSISLRDRTPPSPPTGLTTLAGNLTVELIWHMNPELDVTSYNVYRSTGLDQPFKKINTKPIPSSNPHYVDSIGVGGMQLFYQVSAIDTAGNESKPSNAISALPRDRTPPGEPKNLSCTVVRRMAHLKWLPPGDKDVQGYYVYRGEAPERMAQITTQPVEATSFIDSGFEGKGLVPGRHYVIDVAAVDKSWNESKRARITVVVPDDEPPSPPGAIRIANLDGRALMAEWNASTSLDVAKYELLRGEAGKQIRSLGSFRPDNRRFYDSSVVKGEKYFYQVIAVDTAGNRSIPTTSDTIQARDFSPPPSPRFAAAKATPKGISITWERVVDFDLVGYNIYRSNAPTGIYTRINAKPIKELQYIDPYGTTSSWYKIKAIDTSGNESSREDPIPVKPSASQKR